MENTKLVTYSALSIAFLHLKNTADAQAVYFDIDPDTILDDHFETFVLDMDEDGDGNFRFYNFSYSYEPAIGPTQSRQRIWAGNVGTWYDGIAGSNQEMWSYGGYYSRYIPYVINTGDTIHDLKFDFNDWLFQTFAFRTYSTLIFEEEYFYHTNYRGNWYPEATSKYLGIKFQTDDDSLHYGWIRCSLIDDDTLGFKFIVHDYAYELTANAPILAGDTIGGLPAIVIDTTDTIDTIIDTTVLNELLLEKYISVYSFNKTVYIYLSEELLNNSTIKIYNLAGESIFTEAVQAANTEIDLAAYPASIYFVELITDEKKFVKKLWVE